MLVGWSWGRTARTLGSALLVLAVLAPAAAAAPDLRGNAVSLASAFDSKTDNNGGTNVTPPEALTPTGGGVGCRTDGTPGAGGFVMGGTVWYTTAGNGRWMTLNTRGTTAFDTMLGVYSGSQSQPFVCNDDLWPSHNSNNSELRFKSTSGVQYFFQLGSVCLVNPCDTVAAGDYRITLYSAQTYDDRVNAQAISTGNQTAFTNFGGTEEPGERLACVSGSRTSPYAKTSWFRYTASSAGTAVFSVSDTGGLDTVLSVYRASDGALVGCNDDPGSTSGPSRVVLGVDAGDYLMQVGGYNFGPSPVAAAAGNFVPNVEFSAGIDADGDGVKAPPQGADCDDANAAVHPGAVDTPGDGVDQDCANGDRPVDVDGDGFPASQDCDDHNHAIHPGAGEVPGNFIDENCDHKTPPAPMDPDPQFSLPNNAFPNGARFRPLVVSDVARGYVVKVRCKGRGCPFKTKTRKAKSRRSVRFPEFNGRFLRPKSRVEVYVYLPKRNLTGRYARWTVRAGKQTQRQTSCLKPTKFTKVVRCGSR